MKPSPRGILPRLRIPALLAVGITAAIFSAAPARGAGLLEGRSPADATYLALDAIPRAVYADDPDSLLLWLNAWEEAGGPAEPILRARILGAIWDDAFVEAMYPDDLMDLLAEFSLHPDGPALEQKDLSVGLQRAIALGERLPVARVRGAFQECTTAFADQLLPHVGVNTPEEFFCLLYSGRADQAWALLAGDALAGTRLKLMRDARVRRLKRVLPTFLAIEGGYWSAFNGYAFAGDHPLVGLRVGVRKGPWLASLVLETRPGRTEEPYLARQGDILGVSDRFDALLVGMELGRALPLGRRLWLEGFGGVGFDAVKPLKDEDIVLGALHLDLGGGLRWNLDAAGRYFVSTTCRREWIRPRNTEGSALWGDAWSVRMAFGLNLEAASLQQLDLLLP